MVDVARPALALDANRVSDMVGTIMSYPSAAYDLEQRRNDKEDSRRKDDQRLSEGSVSVSQLRRENGFFSGLAIRRVAIVSHGRAVQV